MSLPRTGYSGICPCHEVNALDPNVIDFSLNTIERRPNRSSHEFEDEVACGLFGEVGDPVIAAKVIVSLAG